MPAVKPQLIISETAIQCAAAIMAAFPKPCIKNRAPLQRRLARAIQLAINVETARPISPMRPIRPISPSRPSHPSHPSPL